MTCGSSPATSRTSRSRLRSTSRSPSCGSTRRNDPHMPALFLVITGFNVLCLVLTAATGYRYGGSEVTQWHPLAGIVATIVCVAVHCVVFTYFVATAKWVEHAIVTKRLDAELSRP